MVSDLSQAGSVPAKKYQLVGGSLCLDFCNTVGGTREGVARENLHSYAHFLSWCEQVGLMNHSEAGMLTQKAVHATEEAALVLNRALVLREAIYRAFLALTRESRPAQSDLQIINAELAQTLGRLRVSPGA